MIAAGGIAEGANRAIEQGAGRAGGAARRLAILLVGVAWLVAAPLRAEEKSVSATDGGFIAVTFFEHSPFGWLSVAWTEPGRLAIAMPPSQPDGPKPEPTEIAVRSASQARLRALLEEIGTPAQAGRGAYVLDIRPPQEAASRLVWSPADETAPLAEIRTGFQELAHLPYRIAVLALARGRDEAASGDDKAALGIFTIGLDSLGTRYAGPEIADDTGMKLLRARDHLSNHRIKEAAAIYGRILEARLELYTQRGAR